MLDKCLWHRYVDSFHQKSMIDNSFFHLLKAFNPSLEKNNHKIEMYSNEDSIWFRVQQISHQIFYFLHLFFCFQMLYVIKSIDKISIRIPSIVH